MIQTPVRSNDRISAPNDRSIGRQIGSENGSDPRLMIRIGATLGLVYLAFLAVWFWATRFRMRPLEQRSILKNPCTGGFDNHRGIG